MAFVINKINFEFFLFIIAESSFDKTNLILNILNTLEKDNVCYDTIFYLGREKNKQIKSRNCTFLTIDDFNEIIKTTEKHQKKLIILDDILLKYDLIHSNIFNTVVSNLSEFGFSLIVTTNYLMTYPYPIYNDILPCITHLYIADGYNRFILTNIRLFYAPFLPMNQFTYIYNLLNTYEFLVINLMDNSTNIFTPSLISVLTYDENADSNELSNDDIDWSSITIEI